MPMGVACNLKCGTPTATYCYQEPIRTAGNQGHPKYDMAAMKAALLKEGYKFTIFGGEPLLVPIDDLAELWRWGLETFGAAAAKHGDRPNGVQTNGTLITEAHFRLFRKYKVGVGMSVDGPDELNDGRWAGSIEATREATAHSLWALDQLLERKLGASIIVTLHRLNASAERLPRLLAWFRDLSAKGLRHVSLHLLEVDMPGVREQLALSAEENIAALLACARLQSEIPVAFSPLNDMVQLLKGEDQWNPREDGSFQSATSCIWNACDPYTTNAVHGVDGQGHRGNCGRTCKEGPFWQKASQVGFERYLTLAHTPQAYGGCQGCRFFSMCKGTCPGEGEQNDWRGKTEHCGVLMRVFEMLEAELVRSGIRPLSVSPERHAVELAQLAAWQAGRTMSLVQLRAGVSKAAAAAPAAGGEHWAAVPPDSPHQDVPHQDHQDVEHPLITHDDHADNVGRIPWAAL